MPFLNNSVSLSTRVVQITEQHIHKSKFAMIFLEFEGGRRYILCNDALAFAASIIAIFSSFVNQCRGSD